MHGNKSDFHGSGSSKKTDSAVSYPSRDIFLYTQKRQLGFVRPSTIVNDYVSQRMPLLLREREFKMGKIDKIFTSQWLNHKQVVFGTKCNKLMVLDVHSGLVDHIPSLKSSDNSSPAACPCGIHSIAVNPSKSLLATGAENTNDLAVYKLPTFDPVCVGERAHTDWIFDLTWLDDEFLVTGSRDNKLGLWQINNSDDESPTSPLSSLQVPEYNFKSPLLVKECADAKKVRALSYHADRRELAVLSLNAYFHIWDIETFTMLYNRRLPHNRENVCMAVSTPRTLYAIGSQSHINLVDPRSKNTLTTIVSKCRGGGVRSVSFQEEIITIGTGVGQILFFDLKAGRYLESGCGHSCTLDLSKGWLRHDDTFYELFYDQAYPNAVYTHQYDSSGTRMFVAGGPLPAGLWGNYAGLWS